MVAPVLGVNAMAEDAETSLLRELQRALLNFSITNPDETALSILNYSAQLTPDEAQPPISTTRLFAGVVAAGQSLVSENATALGSYAAAVAVALAKNSLRNLLHRGPASGGVIVA
jgi:hypothetical protein